MTPSRGQLPSAAGPGSRYLSSLDGLAGGVTEQHAADLCWALMDGHLYHRLVAQRGWTATAFTQWLADSLAATLLPPEAGHHPASRSIP